MAAFKAHVHFHKRLPRFLALNYSEYTEFVKEVIREIIFNSDRALLLLISLSRFDQHRQRSSSA